jgi:nanoRNase/pAp phosphatase (c-di-AMP/oligoRNAs hydrolase)
LEPGIIDHHQPNCGFENQCVASIVVEHGEKYLKHLLGQKEVNIVTHFIPDLDALGSVYFTMKYLNQESF